ncbi:LysR family transcriptional regulator [Paralcaligenes sp. KSB-10]|jgi:DNA-binding transcriptional LysR family regulator|uniref:LysR family transcriptional regulator n=1 Tax=Paralcaligenes sp. KSB-10 TaxID=2901142 RepID=UPI001E2B459A|nr:LysR family transcriptional regulator [Paralcaligenes sp. KSB-10]UHL65144.1 LysR family transcriptional regulator [Paralcaligenes sp. KSB-10]
MDKFKQLESFVSVATLGSLSAAARAEGIAPAMMGRRINALEARLGLKLLIRSTRHLSLTSEGATLLEEAQRILRDMNDTEARITQGSIKPSGHLRISAPVGFGRRHIGPLLPLFIQAHPDITITLDLSDRQVDLIEERYDCAIRIGDAQAPQVAGVRLADSRCVIVAAPSYLDAHGIPHSPEDLLRHNCLSLATQGDQAKDWRLRHKGQTRIMQVKGNLACSDGSVLRKWTLAGCGLAWSALWEVREDLAAGRLVSVLDEYAASPNGIYAMLPERKHLPVRVRAFVDLLKAHYSKASYWETH